ncbi:hypothetical protein [Haloarchaeobius sp. DFWS5]|uniref:hypothetical protein n=1 Tax=Haloarchaeobius sp. DFWS5 TaxID=3446114 RepID=UPI003EBA0101
MITRSVTIEAIDNLHLEWNRHINASALYRRALREEMQNRDVSPHELRNLLNRTQEQGYTLEDITAKTSRVADLEGLVENTE